MSMVVPLRVVKPAFSGVLIGPNLAEDLLDPDWEVEVSVIDRFDGLELYFPWFVYGKPLRRADVGNVRLPAYVSTGVAALSNSIMNYGELSLVLPTYRVPGGELILDGNHRVAVLTLHPEIEFCAVKLSLKGAIDRRILPDLAYWEGKQDD